ncbi:zinc ribbon domain-containing protein [Clostridium estertheticum]|nr:zinc ribbon domain-containing protein [Clostridium estertheticum]WLC73932.1 zinc ribbon domain-containing protein [Clostridium estertheticum]
MGKGSAYSGKWKTKVYPFSNKFRCKYCGASLIRVVPEGRRVNWICATYLQKGKDVCEGMRISEEKLQEATMVLS